jgi:hypothetical protein
MLTSTLVWMLASWDLLLAIYCGFGRNCFLMDHLVSREEQVRQSFLTKWHLMVVFFDINEACDAAWQYGIL